VNDLPEFELELTESTKSYPIPAARESIVPADLMTTPELALEAPKATKWFGAIRAKMPNIENLDLWFSTAYFSICRRIRQVPGAFFFPSLTVWKLR
jgi:hypothetical protein